MTISEISLEYDANLSQGSLATIIKESNSMPKNTISSHGSTVFPGLTGRQVQNIKEGKYLGVVDT